MGSRSRWALLLLLLALSQSGCLRRSIFVRTDPDGARVFLDGEDMGRSPRKIPFQHYGTREIVVRAQDRQSARLTLEVDAPWYQWTPLDFFTDVLIPWTIEDERQVLIVLGPLPPDDLAPVRARAEESRAASGGAASQDEIKQKE